MKLSEIMNTSRAELSRMSGAELHSIVRSAAGTLNRRAQNIKYARGASQIALEKVGFNEPGGRFGTAGTLSGGRYNKNALIRELDRMREFYKSAQSTVREAQQYTKKIEAQFETKGEATAQQLDELRTLENNIWKEVNKQKQLDTERYKETIKELNGGKDTIKGLHIEEQIEGLQNVLEKAENRTAELIGNYNEEQFEDFSLGKGNFFA